MSVVGIASTLFTGIVVLTIGNMVGLIPLPVNHFSQSEFIHPKNMESPPPFINLKFFDEPYNLGKGFVEQKYFDNFGYPYIKFIPIDEIQPRFRFVNYGSKDIHIQRMIFNHRPLDCFLNIIGSTLRPGGEFAVSYADFNKMNCGAALVHIKVILNDGEIEFGP